MKCLIIVSNMIGKGLEESVLILYYRTSNGIASIQADDAEESYHFYLIADLEKWYPRRCSVVLSAGFIYWVPTLKNDIYEGHVLVRISLAMSTPYQWM